MMKPDSPSFLRLIAGNEQDRAACEEWWRNATSEDKHAVWSVMQRRYRDPRMEVMSRFAQMAFGEMAERDIRAGTDAQQE